MSASTSALGARSLERRRREKILPIFSARAGDNFVVDSSVCVYFTRIPPPDLRPISLTRSKAMLTTNSTAPYFRRKSTPLAELARTPTKEHQWNRFSDKFNCSPTTSHRVAGHSVRVKNCRYHRTQRYSLFLAQCTVEMEPPHLRSPISKERNPTPTCTTASH